MRYVRVPRRPLRATVNRVRAWLPEGRSIPEEIWLRRHSLITRFALIQALALGLFGLARGYDPMTCALDVLVVGAPALLARVPTASRRLRTVSATLSLMCASMVFVDLSGGLTEAHFHFFVMIGIVAAYQDWLAFSLCIAVTVLHHAVMGVLAPHSVYGFAFEYHDPVKWALVHGAFVLAASVTHIFAWRAIEMQLLTDSLTGLPNRLAFVESLERTLAARAGALSVLYIDLDNFKAINDSAGHSAGDEVLRVTARRISSVLRSEDMAARLAGDEFAVLVRADAVHAETVAKRILAALHEPVVWNSGEFLVLASIGVADAAEAATKDADDLLHHADVAMYLAKSEGRNQVVVYTGGVAERLRDQAELARDLATALADDQFEVHYQPIVMSSTGALDAVEALLRWNHPVRGDVPAGEFIPIAEQSGAIRPIGIWVLSTAAEQVATWRRELPECANLRLAVNLSPRQLVDPNLVGVVAEALMRSMLPANALILEVTESMLLDDLEHARRQFGRLRELGICIAIDDFGTGYSSLSYLAKLPVDELKIDQSFVRDIEVDAGSRGLVKAIIDMAHALGLATVAEGVEEPGQRTLLSELGCSRAQGYLFAPPLPAAQFAGYAARPRLRAVGDVA